MDKEPYGDVEYADPGYQSDKKKRYPINTEEHARSAWSYINKESNASAYSSEDLARVKSKIRAACKKFGIEIGDESKASGGGYADDAIECRTAVELSGLINNEITYLPAGLHSITPVSGGIGRAINVQVDASAALAIEEQRRSLIEKGKPPYFDFNHEDGKSSFWPHSFIWRAGEGVVACGEWSGSGKKAVKDKDFRAFSPVFYVDNKLGNPAKVVCRENAKPNMGGLVNDPAFSNLPLWAKNDGSTVAAGATSDSTTKGENNNGMNTEEIAALQAKNQELQTRIASLENLIDARQQDATTESELKAARAEHDMNVAKMQLAEAQELAAHQSEEIRAARRSKVDASIRSAIARGAILPRDHESQKSLTAKAMSDEAFISVIDKMPGRGLDQRITFGHQTETSRYQVGNEDPSRILCRIASLSADQHKSRSHSDKMAIAREVSAIYAREISPLKASNSARVLSYPLTSVNDAIMAGDNTDSNLGILSGTLVTQRVLELLKFTFPALTSFTTDFTDQPAQFNQTIVTRTVTVPAVQSYSTASGWTDSTAATTDVPVTINNHKGVPITFNENILQSTVRRLFDEFAEAQAYALGKDMVEALYANITDANFTNNTVIASASFVRNTCVDIQNALNKRGVPFMGRTLLLYSDAFAALQKDSTLVTFAAFSAPDIVRQGQDQIKFVIPVAGFEVLTAPDLPTNNGNVNGFAGSKSALIIATRVPNDYTSVLPGASFGNVSMVTDPDIGITVMQAQYVNHQLGTATSRISLMYGTAAGQGNAGQLIKANTGSGSSH